MMKVTEVPFAFFFFVEVSESDIQSHGAIAHRSRIEATGLHLKTGVEADRPFNHIPAPATLRPGGAVLCMRFDPGLVGIPSLGGTPRLTFEQAAGSNAAQTGFRQIADHLPRRSVASSGFVAGPLVARIDQDLHLVPEPRKSL